jgi:hypothetical protein
MEVRAIPGQPGYFCGSDGTIWSEKRGSRRRLKVFHRGRQGHLGVNLTHDGVYRMHSVHRLVAITFLGTQPTPTHIVMHRDDVPVHNNATNLLWGLPKENSAQMVARGRQARGEQIPWSKLTRTAAREIRQCIAAGEKQNLIAARFGVSASVVTDIKLGRIWRAD